MSAHRVEELRIELGASDEALGAALIERVSALHRQRLEPLIDGICCELSGPERLERIDTLELDLGTLAADSFDDDFARELARALRAALPKAQPRAEVPPGDASLEALEAFARTGNLPWWADRAEREPIARHLRVLLRARPDRLWPLLARHARSGHALARLMRHCDQASFEAMLALRPGAAPWLPVLRELERALERGAAPTGARVELRERIVRALLDDTRPAAERVETLVRELGARIPELARMSRLPRPAPAAANEPSPAANPPASTAGDGSPLGDAAAVHPLALRPRSPLESGSPVRHEAIAATRATPSPREALAQRAISASQALQETSVASDEPRAFTLPLTALERSRRAGAANDAPEPIREFQRASAALERLYVEDAGLVLLWPFLPRFFERTGLLDAERTFAHEPARMQAIALLSQLVFDEPEPHEYRLALCKLLCGSSPAQPFVQGPPLAPDQVQECERVLAAVIEHAPVLRSMPPAELRSSFLRRAGALQLEDGAWVLRVERAPYDIVLEHLAWSFRWLKLPWMLEPLRVEW